ncbi:DUF2161 domain-containing phosphodiesterase [Paenibacillus hamazuiensis]|uniref:DUF2161 domain-containing phosphodiesterase n=1 Tax=Paenibacillus hamazuiensis TaxID=2936508 RepID=UPI0020102190|nr:DUF2161 family putative PD-(D/E)XK-type phosphodiesterase [Paenibacillus hamazuiensis]
MAIRSETELYAPVKAYWEALGYDVRGEVHHCDVVAIRGEEEPVVIELKKSFNIPLLLQAIDRLRLSPNVYVAFELPSKGKAPHGATWTDIRKLCRMLGLGVMTVQFYKTRKPKVEIVCHPEAYMPRPNKRAARLVVQEFKERTADYNVGGSTRRKLVTSYREKALHCASLLKRHGPMSPRQLKELTGNAKAAGLLQKNYYRWFQRVERGVYRLSPLGEQAVAEYAHVVEGFAAETAAAKTETAGKPAAASKPGMSAAPDAWIQEAAAAASTSGKRRRRSRP